MEKKSRILLYSVLLIAFIGLVVWVLSPRQNELANYLPLPNEKAYTVQVNQWLVEKKQAHERAQANKTPEKQAREAGLMSRIISSAEASIKDIYFYGKIVDQYGEPVPGVLVKYKAISVYLAAGTGFGETTTDAEGRFNTQGAEGAGLSIREFIKGGYQFPGILDFDNYQRFEDSVLWKNFTKDKPYVFKAWKVDRYAKVNVGDEIFLFDLGVLYSMDFTASSVKRVKKKGDLDLDVQVLINRDDSGWNVTLSVPNGGLIETDDAYLNIAPESGYQKKITYSGAKEKNNEIDKKYYLHSRGKLYGSLVVSIKPYYRNSSAINFQYVMNLENGRDLAVKQKLTPY